jgi:hypothetical protein
MVALYLTIAGLHVALAIAYTAVAFSHFAA